MESIQEYKGKYRWPLMDIVNDLVEQGGIKDEYIEVTKEMKLKYRQIPFEVYHNYKEGIVLDIEEFEKPSGVTKDLTELIQAFSKVLELKPFCTYKRVEKGTKYIVYEWQRINPLLRYFYLKDGGGIKDLKELS